MDQPPPDPTENPNSPSPTPSQERRKPSLMSELFAKFDPLEAQLDDVIRESQAADAEYAEIEAAKVEAARAARLQHSAGPAVSTSATSDPKAIPLPKFGGAFVGNYNPGRADEVSAECGMAREHHSDRTSSGSLLELRIQKDRFQTSHGDCDGSQAGPSGSNDIPEQIEVATGQASGVGESRELDQGAEDDRQGSASQEDQNAFENDGRQSSQAPLVRHASSAATAGSVPSERSPTVSLWVHPTETGTGNTQRTHMQPNTQPNTQPNSTQPNSTEPNNPQGNHQQQNDQQRNDQQQNDQQRDTPSPDHERRRCRRIPRRICCCLLCTSSVVEEEAV